MKTILNKVLEILGAVLPAGMVAVVLWQVFSRTVLEDPNTVTKGLVRSGLVWFVMLSSAYVVGQKVHLAVTALSEKLFDKKDKILEIVVQSLFLVFAAVIMVCGGQNAVTLTVGQISPPLSIPMGYIYSSVPVSGILIIIYSLINLTGILNNKPAIQEKI